MRENMHYKKNQLSLFAFLRDFLFLFIAIWLICPMNSFLNWYIYIIVLALWICFAFLTNPILFSKILLNKYSIIIFAWPTIIFILSLYNWADFSIYQYSIPFIFLFFSYYSKVRNQKIMKFILILILLYIVIININSIVQLIHNPHISRILANSDKSVTEEYASPFMANFDHTQNMVAYVLVIFALMLYYKLKKIEKLFLIVTGCLSIVLIIYTQYTYAILLTFLFLFLIYYINPYNKIKTKIIKITIGICITSVFAIFLGDILIAISNITQWSIVQSRIYSLGILLKYGSTEGDVALRLEKYLISLGTFANHPIIGVGGKVFRANGLVGGHSTFFDTIAYYGIFIGGFYIYYVFSICKHICNIFIGKDKKIVSIIMVMYIVECFINLMMTESTTFMIFFLIPMMVWNNKDVENYQISISHDVNDSSML